MNNLTIRKALEKDISKLQIFIFLHGKNPWNFLPEKEVKDHISKIATGQVHAFIAEIDNECVGFVIVYLGLPENPHRYEKILNDTVAYLAEIVVHRENVGKGIGKKLIEASKADLVSSYGIKKLYAERHADNLASAGVMNKAGFKIIDEFYDPKRRPTDSQKTVVTCLEL